MGSVVLLWGDGLVVKACLFRQEHWEGSLVRNWYDDSSAPILA
jgi:hypothetical protein